LKEYGVDVTWENIGDPIEKGEKIPEWMKDTLTDIMKDDMSYAYSPTKGIEKTREFLAEEVNKRGKYQLDKEDIIFSTDLETRLHEHTAP